ncbi:hypothetical protein BEWA_027240 [Theileria equi strain WA]|uniref:Uncharacterized protein n=1 Tax=Theileria equi strain WA TaxID=1537102 RepID=L0AWG2_THEEQ|nr:hypothetical protein BEWA_027240 [Theileria equi strain WA]AFZ79875.1 hypothetical protein BEWA_027240 [Theileria equi strain WA]|eukprot:XP_004829541.1 hypothetical protein BEWA_027240 [Theileria equi strain WA]
MMDKEAIFEALPFNSDGVAMVKRGRRGAKGPDGRGEQETAKEESGAPNATKVESGQDQEAAPIEDGYQLICESEKGPGYCERDNEEGEKISSRSTIYDDMLKIYVDRSRSITYEENPSRDPMVWFSLFILASNPLVAIYLLYHFNNWQPWAGRSAFSDGSVITTVSSVISGAKSDAAAEGLSLSTKFPLKGLATSWLALSGGASAVAAPASIVRIASSFARLVQEYAFFEVFGEIGFALFSLVLIILCRLPCSDKKYRIQSVLPCIAMLYMVIYKILALYVLTTGIRLLLFYLFIVALPELPIPQFATQILAISIGGDDAKMFRELYKMDMEGHFWLMVFCAENIYITVTDTIELFYTLSRMASRGTRRLVAKLKRQQESLYYTLAPGDATEYTGACSSCSYLLMENPAESDPHEKYIHSMYNDRTDVGTYLKNIDIKEYSRGLENFSAKILKQGQE